jgi:hypothetical protein
MQVWGIVGNGTPGGWDADTKMTYNKVVKLGLLLPL